MSTGKTYIDLPPRAIAAQTTAEQVANVLRDDIVCGTLEPGRPLPEVHVAESFGVSRRSAREALRILQSDGLVRHQRHRGSSVAEFSRDDLLDLYGARAVVEATAAERSGDPAVHATPAYSRLQEAMAALHDATAAADARAIVTADLRFHSALVALLDSPRIDRFFASIATEMMFAIALLEEHEKRTSPRRPLESLAEHRAIFDAVTAGDGATARVLVLAHLSSSRDGLAGAWASR